METQNLIYLVSCAVNGVKLDPERVAGMDLDAVFFTGFPPYVGCYRCPGAESGRDTG